MLRISSDSKHSLSDNFSVIFNQAVSVLQISPWCVTEIKKSSLLIISYQFCYLRYNYFINIFIFIRSLNQPPTPHGHVLFTLLTVEITNIEIGGGRWGQK